MVLGKYRMKNVMAQKNEKEEGMDANIFSVRANDEKTGRPAREVLKAQNVQTPHPTRFIYFSKERSPAHIFVQM